jgi:glycosyltransferase involved in cell wall biosynthesis
MKVLHVPYTWWPDAVGGTEVYVAQLCEALIGRGVGCGIAAPADTSRDDEVDGLVVRRFETDSQPALEALYGNGDPIAAAAFERVLDAERPDIVHLHALSPACSVRLLEAARRRNLATVFTYHTPAASCQRGTMLRWGREPCEGVVERQACSACTLHGLGVPRRFAEALGRVPPRLGSVLSHMSPGRRGALALRMPSLLIVRRARLRGLIELADRIVVLAPWVRNVLLKNGADAGQLVDSPHGVDQPPVTRPNRGSGPLRVACLGRRDPSKGAAVLLDALRGAPGLDVELHLFGADTRLLAQVADSTADDDDPRVHRHAPVARADVPRVLAGVDAVVIPSQGFETGPLIALEARALGLPIIASRIPNLDRVVAHRVDGLLVDAFDRAEAWVNALSLLAADRSMSRRTGARSRTWIRSVGDVADDMVGVYETVLGKPERGAGRRTA